MGGVEVREIGKREDATQIHEITVLRDESHEVARATERTGAPTAHIDLF